MYCAQGVLFVLEYGIRYALVPGRVETWILIIDLEGVGMSMASSENREIAAPIGKLRGEIYTGRIVQTNPVYVPWIVRSFASSIIPNHKKDSVKFVGGKEIQAVMRGVAEPLQLGQRYGGTAPDLAPEETYPFRAFHEVTRGRSRPRRPKRSGWTACVGRA